MPFVGAVAAPHSHLQLFTRPAENEDYKAKVARGRRALGVLREQVDKSGADTMLVIHDDHFVNFDFRCYPPFCLLIGKEAKGSGVIDPAEIETITGAVYKKYQGKTSYGSAPAGIAAAVNALAKQLLGRHVVDCAHQRSRLSLDTQQRFLLTIGH